MIKDDNYEEDAPVRRHLIGLALAAHVINTGLDALFSKCARAPEIKRSVGRETLFYMLLWRSMEKLDVEHVKPDLLGILAEKIGFTEARRQIDRREQDWREAIEYDEVSP